MPLTDGQCAVDGALNAVYSEHTRRGDTKGFVMEKELPKTENDYSIIIATAGDKEAAVKIARLLVERRLAACVQMLPVESVYRWQEKICQENETALIIKSRTALFDEIKTAIKENHSYEVPEIIQTPITNGLPDYLNWIGDCTRRD